MSLREAYECEFDTKHLIDVVQTRPMPTWGYVEWLEERLQEFMESPADSPASPVQQLKAEICDCDEGIAWRTEARQNPLSNIVYCAACGRKLSAV